jgi:hypothetical protein
MDWRTFRDGFGVIAFLGLWLWVLDFFAFAIGSLLVGGVHFYGRAGGGEYSLAFRATGPFTPVSEAVYYYSVYHWWSIIGLACVFGPAMLAYVLTGGPKRNSLA